MPTSFDDLKWLLLTIIWPLGKWIVNQFTGRLERRLGTVKALGQTVEESALREAKYLVEIAQLKGAVESLNQKLKNRSHDRAAK